MVSRGGRSRARERAVARWEARVSATCLAMQDHTVSGQAWPRFVLRHPLRLLAAAYGLLRLPRLTADLGTDPEGLELREGIQGGVHLGAFRHRSVLVLPSEPGQYSLGAHRQSLRRQVRKAQALGVQWKQVDDPEERRAVLRAGADWERVQPDARYRNEAVDNSELLEMGLWLVAYQAPENYLLLSVTPVSGPWARLSLYRTIGRGEAQTKARYLLAEVLAEELVRRGVHYLVDGREPAGLPNGLRHFQRILGFRIHRVSSRFHRAPAPRTQRAVVRIDAASASRKTLEPCRAHADR